MQRKQGFTPLPKPWPICPAVGLRKTTPPVRRGFTVADQVNRWSGAVAIGFIDGAVLVAPYCNRVQYKGVGFKP